MAIERNLCGFEVGDRGELFFGGTAALSNTLLDLVTTPVRSGSWSLKLAPAGGTPTQCTFPAGSVTGTTGTVTAGNHKRVRARVFFQFTARTFPFGNQASRLFGLGTDTGYPQIVNNTSTIANTGISLWVYADGRFFVHIPPSTATNYGGPETQFSTGVLLDGQWYQVLFDIDYSVSANTTVTAIVRVINDGGTPLDETVTATNRIGATDLMPQIAIGSGVGFGFPPTYISYWDDLLWIATSTADATSAITLPTETHILSFVPTGTTVNAWSGTAADVDERPVASPGSPSAGDTINSTGGTGTTVTLTHASAASLGITGLRAWKLYINAAIAGAGTGLLDVVLNGVTTSLTVALTYPAAATGVGNPVGGLNWADLSPSAFDAATFSVIKQNGTQQTYIGNLVGEVLNAAIPDPVQITTTTLPGAVSGTAYAQTIVATGGTPPYVFTVLSGTLPPGLSLASSGAVSGTPAAIGSIAPTTLPAAEAGVAYAQTLSIINSAGSYPFTARVTDALAGFDDQALTLALTGVGPYTYAVVAGSLPPSLSLAAGGALTGTPTGSPAITPFPLPNGLVDVLYLQQLAISGTSAIYAFTVRATIGTVSPADQAYSIVLTVWGSVSTAYAVITGALPKCVTCSTTGLLRGMPMQVGSAAFTIRATDNVGRVVDRAFTLTSTS